MTETDIQDIITTITAAIKKNPLAEDVTIDGTRISMPRANEKLEFWQKKLEQLRGNKPVLVGVNMSGGAS
jgi:hypothetical protein